MLRGLASTMNISYHNINYFVSIKRLYFMTFSKKSQKVKQCNLNFYTCPPFLFAPWAISTNGLTVCGGLGVHQSNLLFNCYKYHCTHTWCYWLCWMHYISNSCAQKIRKHTLNWTHLGSWAWQEVLHSNGSAWGGERSLHDAPHEGLDQSRGNRSPFFNLI